MPIKIRLLQRFAEMKNFFLKFSDNFSTPCSAYDLEFFTLGRDSFIVAASSSDRKKEVVNVIHR